MTLLVLVVGSTGIIAGPADAAGSASVTITPATSTVKSGTTVTYTLGVSCSVTGGCTDMTVTIPTTAITGDGTTTDFGAWVGSSSCAGVTTTTAGGVLTFSYGDFSTGSENCTFTVHPPEYTTYDNTTVTITPTINGSDFTSSTAPTPAVLTVTAGHDDSLNKSVPTTVVSGDSFAYTLSFLCGTGGDYQGDVGLSALSITDTLPSNFTYTSASTNAFSGDLSFNAGVVTYSDPTGASCADPPLNVSNVVTVTITGTASQDGTPDLLGSTICNQASSTFTYVDGTSDSSTSPDACTTVTTLTFHAAKVATTTSLGSLGQYRFNGNTYPYTYPGNWDDSGSPAAYKITLTDSAKGSGADWSVQDPLPCLDNVSDGTYSSSSPGTACARPAFVPTMVTATGFPVTSADVITLLLADGTTTTVPYAAGSWTIPAGLSVSEIDFPTFSDEGNNTALNMVLTVSGYAAAATPTTSLLSNTMDATPYPVGSSTAYQAAIPATANLMVVSAVEPSGTVFYPSVTSSNAGNCTENVALDSSTNGVLANFVELASAPSQAIYIDYLAPAGATGISNEIETFALAGRTNGQKFTTATLTPTSTTNFNDTGRTLYEWIIPPGTITVPGDYEIEPANRSFVVSLPAGCDGTYENDLTLGYGASITGCIFDNYSSDHESATPMVPAADSDLEYNGDGSSNYCGFSSPLNIAATNPGFSIDKTVQGNLDGSPVSAGGTGNVSPLGGTATYDITFANTGAANLSNPVMYDILPAVGDTESSALTGRGSQFPVTLTGIGTLPAGVTVSYSQSANPCRPEVLASDPGCVDDWSTTAPVSLTTVKALEFAYTGTVYVSGAGTSSISVPFTVSTPAVTAGQTAWNSVGGTADAGVGGAALTPAESSLTGLQALAGPTITKTSSTADYAHAGDAVTYTYTVTNDTGVPLAGVDVTDNLVDDAAGDVAPTATCKSLASPTATCSGTTTTLAPGQVATFVATYTVVQADVDHGLVSDTATASGTPPTGSSISGTSNQVVVPAAQTGTLSISKTLDPSSPSPVTAVGQVLTYDFTVTNTGDTTEAGVGVQDTQAAPAGALTSGPTCQSLTSPTAPCSGTTTTLAPGQVATFTATYTATLADLTNGSIADSAIARGTSPTGAVSSPASPLTVPAHLPAVGLTVTKTVSASPFVPGEPLTYEVTVANSGPTTATGATVQDILPVRIVAFTWTCAASTNAVCSAAGSGSIRDTVTIPAGGQVVYTVTGTVPAAAVVAPLTNTATVTPPAGTSDPACTPSCSSTVTDDPDPTVDLTVSKTSTPNPYVAGSALTYTVTVTNAGPSYADGVTVSDPLPTALATGGFTWTCTASAGAVCTASGSGDITDTVRIPVGGQVAYTETGTVPAGTTGQMSNTVTVAPASGNTDPACSPDCTATNLNPPTTVDLSATKTSNPSPYVQGETLTYTVTVANAGPGTATDASVSDPLPTALAGAGFTWTCTPSTGATCTASGSGDITDAVTVPAGGQVVYTVTGTVPVSTTATLDNAVTVTPPPGDTDPGCTPNCGSTNHDPPVTPQPGLSVVKHAGTPVDVNGDGEVDAGDTIAYTFDVTDTGNVPLTGVAVNDTKAGPVTCPQATLLPGASETCTATTPYTITTADVNAGGVKNTATASGTDPQGTTVTSDPSSTNTPTVVPAPPGPGGGSTPPPSAGSGGGTPGSGGHSAPEQPLSSIATGHGWWGPGGPTGTLLGAAGIAVLALGGASLAAVRRRRRATA